MEYIKNLPKSQLAFLAITGIFLFILPIPHTIALRLFTLFLAAMLSFYLVRKQSTPSLPLKAPLALWIGFALFSLIFAINPIYSLGEIKSEILYGVLAYVIFFSQAHGEMEYKWWMSVLLGSLVVISLTEIMLWYKGEGAILPKYIYNGVGPHLTLLITLFPFIALMLFKTNIRKFPDNLIWLILPLVLVSAYLTHNRMFWIAATISAAILFILLGLKEKNRRQKIKMLLFLTFIAVVSASLFYQALANRVTKDSDGGTGAIVDKTLDQDPRPRLWDFSLKQIVHSPWVGIGFGVRSFDYAYPEWEKSSRTLFHAHNIFINAGIQMGIPGILVLMLLFFSILREYWRFYKSVDVRLQWLGACGLAMVIGVLMKNMTDHFFSRDLSLLFWSLVGMTLGYGERLQDRIKT
jgi:O-antigen ligase